MYATGKVQSSSGAWRSIGKPQPRGQGWTPSEKLRTPNSWGCLIYSFSGSYPCWSEACESSASSERRREYSHRKGRWLWSVYGNETRAWWNILESSDERPERNSSLHGSWTKEIKYSGRTWDRYLEFRCSIVPVECWLLPHSSQKLQIRHRTNPIPITWLETPFKSRRSNPGPNN